MDLTVHVESSFVPRETPQTRVIELWLATKRSLHTRRSYARDIRAFCVWMQEQGCTLQTLTLEELQQYADGLTGKPRSIARRIYTLKSLFTFCLKSGYLAINKGSFLVAPKFEKRLAERILSEAQVQRMLAMEEDPRNHAILRLFYNTGARVSEVGRLQWRDIFPAEHGGKVRLWGKGEKERYVLISQDTYQEILQLRGDATDEMPVFVSRTTHSANGLSRKQLYRIVRDAGKRSSVKVHAYPHKLRHSHITHALKRKAPPQVVSTTVGHSSLAMLTPYAHVDPDESSGQYLPI